uniref:Uncharacterized protein MANES_15G081300 n=1 Tax=Rhizophora mucronata TaxID=61149 RepID=A0A2P2JM40_RHIMU
MSWSFTMWILYGICASLSGFARSPAFDAVKAAKSSSSCCCCWVWFSSWLIRPELLISLLNSVTKD